MKPIFVGDDNFKKLQEISSRSGSWYPINKLLEEAIDDLVEKYDKVGSFRKRLESQNKG